MFRALVLICALSASIPATTSAEALDGTATPTLTLGVANADTNGRASIDVILSPGDRPISAIQFDVQYQNQTLGISESPGSATISAGKSLWASSPQSGARRILIAGVNAVPIGNGVVATLSVTLSAGAPPGLYPLVLSSVSASDSDGHPVSLAADNGAVTVPGPVVLAVANAASYEGTAVAPGELVVIGGRSLGAAVLTTLQISSNGVLARSLAGTTVLFDGIPAPLVYATQNQLCAIVPYEVDGHSQTFVQVEFLGIRSAPFVLAVMRSFPGVFTSNGSGKGQAAIVNQDGSINGPDNPALRGSIVSVYGTGEGQTIPAGVDGRIVGPSEGLQPILPVTGSIGDQPAEVVYAGSAGGQVSGLLQVNLRVPFSVVPGSAVPVRITIGRSSQSGVTMSVQ